MINRFILTIIPILFFIIACESGTITNKYSDEKISYSLIERKIPVDSIRLPAYFIFCIYTNPSKVEYLYGYNKQTHSIDIFNLSKLLFERSIKLDNQGPNGVAIVSDIFVLNKDSVFLYSRGTVSIINRAGKLIDKINLFENINYKKFGELSIIANFRLEYDKENHAIYFYSIYQDSIKEKSIVTQYDYLNKKFTKLPIYHSDLYKSGQMGFTSYLNKSFSIKNFIIYNFEYDPNIYSYNKITGGVNIYGAQSQYSLNKFIYVNKKDPDLWQRRAIENTHFLTVLKDEYRPFYYRFHWGSIKLRKNNNQFNSFIDKPFYLMIFNDNFKIVDEIKLKENRYNKFSWAIVKDGILLMKSHPMYKDVDNNYLKFDILKIIKK